MKAEVATSGEAYRVRHNFMGVDYRQSTYAARPIVRKSRIDAMIISNVTLSTSSIFVR